MTDLPAWLARPGLETPHRVGAAGQPAFGVAWTNYGNGYVPGAFYKDPFGLVHLEGTLSALGVPGDEVFTLPPGYQPVSARSLLGGNLNIASAGRITYSAAPAGTILRLETIVFNPAF